MCMCVYVCMYVCICKCNTANNHFNQSVFAQRVWKNKSSNK